MDSAAPATPVQQENLPILLITNDDGIYAPGLRALVALLVETGRFNVCVCAPIRMEKSAVGHSITAWGNIAVRQVLIKGATAFELSRIFDSQSYTKQEMSVLKEAGTPADCVSLALSGALFPWSKPTLVLSGINKGSNCGYHIIYSGTVAGAREAFICGVPSIALSYNWVRGESNARDFGPAVEACLPLIDAVVSHIVKGSYPQGFFLNVDVPPISTQHKGYKVTKQGTSMIRTSWKAVIPENRLSPYLLDNDQGLGIQIAQLGLEASAVISEQEYGEEGDDLDFGALEAGYITITPLGLKSHVDSNIHTSFKSWVSDVAELGITSSL